MIAIINTGKMQGNEHIYRVQINKKLICFFKHNRKKGLASCLRSAAKAVQLCDIYADRLLEICMPREEEPDDEPA